MHKIAQATLNPALVRVIGHHLPELSAIIILSGALLRAERDQWQIKFGRGLQNQRAGPNTVVVNDYKHLARGAMPLPLRKKG